MRHVYLACLFLCLAAAFSVSPAIPAAFVNHIAKVDSPFTAPVTAFGSAAHPEPKNQTRILDGYGKLPLSFEVNHGQSDGRVKFLSRSGGYTLFLTRDEAVLALRGGNSNSTQANSREMRKASAVRAWSPGRRPLPPALSCG